MKEKKTKKKVVKEGLLDSWSLISQFNTDHEDFGTVARFLNGGKWKVKISYDL